ncbi:AbrB/MazE/SpoVT family DNA-binding domain-containing protein [Cyanobacterium aponinum UTEX 3222]|uniref:Addiction module antidote n=3 Tax=Cyanobacterium aponinum TaxID=379064 RepID=K9Z1W9_CYAAP|nr:AbrB/MazE/SpoVT family DNA-binding domain-containing protein [Cyanobacterium aponinum]WRL41147.1 AbrB/MazE/SpoVT family DNA-binding domain-containing protein [Cyanobacterium aponinum UTEX 3222]AFZ53176.1 addiction module antidote [Cyanobacterium aponinum PCC 10605]MBD2395831.1 AbrB/MazE/SpoVT family DNA-binding domain-containing protein [Cyanobacterium aponinum FACHB-4101]MTF40718.1 AbrB/MazE/SpoVT family DNA-binding domain-containing protein [Cyanobacterium aponinum 0216]PHV64178.1 AbrB/Ma
MFRLKVTTVGNSTGVILPKEVLAKMHVEKGDNLYLTPTPNGFEITPYNPEFEQEMETAREIMKQYRNALRELAK